MKNAKTANIFALCESALLIALAVVLSLLKFPPFRIDLWANGGSIDFVMVPLIIIGWRRGVRWAVPAGIAFGFIKCLIGEALGWGVLSVVFDYVLAYALVGLSGLFKNKGIVGLAMGASVASLGRFLCHFTSGITIWKIALGESYELFGMTFDSSNAVLYSLLYNGSYMLGELVYCLVVLMLLYKPLSRMRTE